MVVLVRRVWWSRTAEVEIGIGKGVEGFVKVEFAGSSRALRHLRIREEPV